jgi:glycosyltransferase involved in cell wall biosynthesis
MRILFCSRYLNAPRGGAEISALTLLDLLSRRHKVYVFSIANNKFVGNSWTYNMELLEWKFSTFLQKRILPGELREFIIEKLAVAKINAVCKKIKPDLIISQGNILFPDEQNFKKTMFIVDHGSSVYDKQYSVNIILNLLNCFFSWLRRKKLVKADLVICPSKYMVSLLNKYKIRSFVVSPFIDLANKTLTNNFHNEFITFINPTHNKGVNLISKIAKNMGNKKFLIVGRMRKPIVELFRGCSNVTFSNWTKNMQDIYKSTRILLVPTIIKEPFGMVAVEASNNCIPIIASNTGGLPESVGNGGILINNYKDINGWMEAIKFLDNQKLYAEYSLKAKKYSEKFNILTTLNDFVDLMRNELGISL